MIGVFVFGGILLLLGATVVLSAVRGRSIRPGGESPSPADRRDAAIDVLSELEFEFRTEKLGEAEYRALRQRLGSEALRAKAEMEETLPPSDPALGGCDGCGSTLDPGDDFCPECGRAVASGPDRGSG